MALSSASLGPEWEAEGHEALKAFDKFFHVCAKISHVVISFHSHRPSNPRQ